MVLLPYPRKNWKERTSCSPDLQPEGNAYLVEAESLERDYHFLKSNRFAEKIPETRTATVNTNGQNI